MCVSERAGSRECERRNRDTDIFFVISFPRWLFILLFIAATLPQVQSCSGLEGGAICNFIDPVDVSFQGDALQAYLLEVPEPMDFGTVIERLVLGQYETSEQLLADAAKVARNCETYWGKREVSGCGGGRTDTVF